MDSNEKAIAMSFTVVGVIIGGFLMLVLDALPRMHDIESGENFIYGSATYKCEKTNELTEGDE